MDNKNRNGMSMSKVEQLFKHLEARVDEFIELCDEYKRHNRSLQARESQLAEERASLMKKNDMAKAKVEAMISRLKALEQDS
ncbi:MAG: TIGR02449 family protein [Pseudomonadota bacterium]|nr:TIGR02449 family protein [Pseudomonadota bacterium]